MENKNGQGIFLGVVGVATLIVAIIGATFAFFSAQTTAGDGVLEGQTLGGTEGGVVSLKVEKVWTAPTDASSLDLVPTNLNVASNLQSALNAKCEATSGTNGDTNKYTGCHVFRITVSSESDIAGTDLVLSELNTTNTKNIGKWHYAFFEAEETATGTFATSGTGAPAVMSGKSGDFNITSTGGSANPVTVFTGEELNEENDHTIVKYLVVYVENVETTQNLDDGNNVTGSYTGTLTATTTGGSTIKATFS